MDRGWNGRRDQALRTGEVLLLENLRFHAEEEKKDAASPRPSVVRDIFVNEASGRPIGRTPRGGIAKRLP